MISTGFAKTLKTSNFMQIRPVRAEFLRADIQTDRQTDRQNVTNLLVTFSNCAKALEKGHDKFIAAQYLYGIQSLRNFISILEIFI